MTLTVTGMMEKMKSVMTKHANDVVKKIDNAMQVKEWLESEKTLTSYTMGFFEVEIDGHFPQEVQWEVSKIYTSSGQWKRVDFVNCDENGASRNKVSIVKLIFGDGKTSLQPMD